MMLLPPSTSRLATAASAAASALAYPFLPDRLATHFDAQGRPDRYGSRRMAALGLPAVMASLVILNGRLGEWPGAHDRADATSGAHARAEAIGVAALGLLATHLVLLANGLGLRFDVGRVLRAVYGVVIIALGNILPKLPRNGWVGIRTPWTLADPSVWERTHRVGGYLCMAAGLVTLASLPATGRRAAQVPTVALIGAVVLSTGYSAIAFARRGRT